MRVEVPGLTRVIRYRHNPSGFAPWDVCTLEGRTLWSSPSLESAFRWIQVRTGYPTEAILIEGLLAQEALARLFRNRGATERSAVQKEGNRAQVR
jgi:hypothetical protein